MIFRFDDISPNTDFDDLAQQLDILRENFNAKFIVGINILAKSNIVGSVYPNPPFKDRDKMFFYDVDRVINWGKIQSLNLDDEELCSHGLFHIDHSKLSRDAQEISILASCNFIGAKKFIPPFNRFNDDTKDICLSNGIDFINSDYSVEWKNLETEKFDPSHQYWYYHPFRICAMDLAEKISGGIK